MNVSELMNREPVWVTSSQKVGEVANIMLDTDSAFLPVVEDGRAIGVVTDRDIALALGARGFKPENSTVRDVMSPEPYAIDIDASLEDVANEIIARGVHRLVVVHQSKFVGVISMVDLAGHVSDSRLAQALKMLAEHNHPRFIHHERRSTRSQQLAQPAP